MSGSSEDIPGRHDRYCEEKFVSKYIPTIGVDYGVKPNKYNDYEVGLGVCARGAGVVRKPSDGTPGPWPAFDEPVRRAVNG